MMLAFIMPHSRSNTDFAVAKYGECKQNNNLGMNFHFLMSCLLKLVSALSAVDKPKFKMHGISTSSYFLKNLFAIPVLFWK